MRNISSMQNKGAFTLVEILVGILIFSLVVIWWFQALSAVTIWKARLVHKATTQKQIIYFSQRLFEEIKLWGLIDYEEYFNRQIVWTSFMSGHYDTPSWFWNFWNNGSVWTTMYWDNFYYCLSWNGLSEKMTGTGCIDAHNSPFLDYSGKPQRYWQYSFQFIDYNSNFDNDGWDENGDGNILWDDDDEYLGKWPEWFVSWVDVKELYLLSGDKTKRTLFRWKVEKDPSAPATFNCSIDGNNIITGSWCIGTIEFLKLEWRDWWMDHVISTDDIWEYDGVIDTWLVQNDFSWGTNKVAGSDNENYWVPLFPDTINISDFKVFVYPNKDLNLSWKEVDDSINISPYVRIQLSILPSWKSRRKIKGTPEEIHFTTTIALSDIFSK